MAATWTAEGGTWYASKQVWVPKKWPPQAGPQAAGEAKQWKPSLQQRGKQSDAKSMATSSSKRGREAAPTTIITEMPTTPENALKQLLKIPTTPQAQSPAGTNHAPDAGPKATAGSSQGDEKRGRRAYNRRYLLLFKHAEEEAPAPKKAWNEISQPGSLHAVYYFPDTFSGPDNVSGEGTLRAEAPAFEPSAPKEAGEKAFGSPNIKPETSTKAFGTPNTKSETSSKAVAPSPGSTHCPSKADASEVEDLDSIDGGGALPNAQLPSELADMSEKEREVRKQIEYYFSVQNLVDDWYLRSCMDEEGWVSLEFILQFPRIRRLGGTSAKDAAALLLGSGIVEVSWDSPPRVRLRGAEIRSAFVLDGTSGMWDEGMMQEYQYGQGFEEEWYEAGQPDSTEQQEGQERQQQGAWQQWKPGSKKRRVPYYAKKQQY
uniref:HTH La-type RNA-binding domain-containing protein n=1 Tax=Zooxanthella nutricula TaxID=1333877 RepID=A0A6U8VBZ9_9DINO|mmetsp:Transcript_49560/g.150858  ORF Transcript_49560/g.150858 Transcript_49560/m.150858 type:complete len:431 (+) Transcript_49560:74-1366(+)